jgi:hypothetical protein
MQPQWPPSFHAVTAALTNPSSYVSAYYAQAYAQKKPATTAEGYSLSSTYVPGSHAPLCANQAGPSTSYRPAPQRREHESPIAWYQPGSCRCTYKQCNFTGSQKALEVHMMDRHLIYPRGWNDRKKRDDWDADHSLKGYVSIRLCLTLAVNVYVRVASRSRSRAPTSSWTVPSSCRNGLPSGRVGGRLRKECKRKRENLMMPLHTGRCPLMHCRPSGGEEWREIPTTRQLGREVADPIEAEGNLQCPEEPRVIGTRTLRGGQTPDRQVPRIHDSTRHCPRSRSQPSSPTRRARNRTMMMTNPRSFPLSLLQSPFLRPRLYILKLPIRTATKLWSNPFLHPSNHSRNPSHDNLKVLHATHSHLAQTYCKTLSIPSSRKWIFLTTRFLHSFLHQK